MKNRAVIILLIALLFTNGCQRVITINDNDNKITYFSISQKKAKEMIDHENVIILDVREAYEFSEGHLLNALLIPLGILENEAEDILNNKNATILVYCRSGSRSRQAAEILISLGYTHVFDIGGINTWPYDIIN